METLNRISAILKHWGLSVAASGSVLVLIQNVLLISGLAILLTEGSPIGGDMFSFGLYLDLIGIFLIGFGLLSLTLGDSMHQPRASRPFWTPARLGAMSGALCLAWVVLTVAWRIVGMGIIRGTLDAAAALSPDSPELSAAMSSMFTQITAVTVIWMVASIALALASIFFAFFLKGRSGGERSSAAWPFFCILNAAATVFLASVIIALANGEVAFPTIATAAFLKLVTVPIFGVIAYASLSWKLLSLSRAEAGETPVKSAEKRAEAVPAAEAVAAKEEPEQAKIT